MKKYFFLALSLVAFGFAACTNEEEGGGEAQVAAVTNLQATAESDTEVTLTWTNPTDEAFSYVKVSYKRDGEQASTPVEVEAGATSYTFDDLTYKSGKMYTFTVQSFSADNKAGKSATVKSNTMNPDEVAVPAVSNLSAEAGHGNVTLTWDDPEASNFYSVRITYTTDEGDQELEAYAGDGETGFVIPNLLKRWGEIEFTLTSLDEDGNAGESATISAECLRAELVRLEYREKREFGDGWDFWVRGEYTAWQSGFWEKSEEVKASYERKITEYSKDNLYDGNEDTYFGFIDSYDYMCYSYDGYLWGAYIVNQPWIQIAIDPALKGSFKGIDITLQNAKGTTKEDIDFAISWDVWIYCNDSDRATEKELGWGYHKSSQSHVSPNTGNNWTLWQEGFNTSKGIPFNGEGYTEEELATLSGAKTTMTCISMPDGSDFNHIRLALMMGQGGDGNDGDYVTNDDSLPEDEIIWYEKNFSHCRIAEMTLEFVKEKVTDPEADDPDRALTPEEIEAIEAELAQAE